VNTPSPQGSTGITTNVFPAMTLGCGAVAGNSTSDNIGPQHLINIKRLAYVVRTPQEAFEMPLSYGPAQEAAPAADSGGAVNRAMLVAAVDRYLASRGIGAGARAAEKQPAVARSVVEGIAEQVVRELLSRRGVTRSGPGEKGGNGY
jgi:acetaldehyde dehydrogenase (acetylating)